jgi:hypothetical protein
MVCDPRTGACVPDQSEDCGANTSSSGGCSCLVGWLDCNNDIGQPGGDGCECSGVCNGTACDTSSAAECHPLVPGDCDGTDTYCNGGRCDPCPTGLLNCDGVSECECDGECTGQVCDSVTPSECNADEVDACGGSGQYCNLGTCTPCPTGKLNCDGVNECECGGGCDGDDCIDYNAMSCIDLALEYGTALSEARECDPTATPDPCTHVTTGDISCGCEIWVNATKTDAIATMERVKAAAKAKDCTYSCPPTGCATYTSSTCEALASGDGECQYH